MEITFLFAAVIALFLSLRVPSEVIVTVASSLLHETGHLAVMTAVGNRPECVRLELCGMNIKRMQSVGVSMRNEIFIALGGPFANALLFAVFTLVYCFNNNSIFLNGACINLVLMVFNLLPVKRLDGGMLLYFLLSEKRDGDFAAKVLKKSSACFIILIYLWGIYVFAAGGYNITVLIIAIFLTISMFGRGEY